MPYQEYLQKTGGFIAGAGHQRGTRPWLAGLIALLLCWCSPLWAADDCLIAFDSVTAAPELQPGVRPAEGWQSVTLPDFWHQHWPDHQGAVWYRLGWTPTCPSPLALTLDRITMAGSVYLNDALIWQDIHLQEPYSRSWNRPRYWVLPDHLLQGQLNAIWVRVVGMSHDNLGLGVAVLGAPQAVWPVYQQNQWHQRHLFVLNLVISLVLGFLFLSLWLVRRKDSAFGWLALASFAWALFDYTLLATSLWPFATSADWNRFAVSTFAVYNACFCLFVWRFGAQPMRVFGRLLWLLLGVALAALWLVPVAGLNGVMLGVGAVFSSIFLLNCLQFQIHAWRHPLRHNVLLAACLLLFFAVSFHDLLVVLQVLGGARLYAPFSSPAIMLVMFFVIADRFASDRRRIEMFNSELQQAVDSTRQELTRTLGQQHKLELHNTRLNERLSLIHDLHDGLGSSLMRSIALVEAADNTLDRDNFLALLTELRNDLRQIIDNSTSANLTYSDTPAAWLAPMRHRFVRLFDELDLTSRWNMPATWPCLLTSRQQLSLARFLEEALTNAIKHSGAHCFEVTMLAHQGGLVLHVKDNGSGMDTDRVNHHAQGIGMHSMRARAERMGGSLDISSRPGRTCLSLYLPPPSV